jgi:hypothetical protein
MKIKLKDIRKVEREYANALSIWGDRNMITIRAEIKYYDLKRKYEEEKNERRKK